MIQNQCPVDVLVIADDLDEVRRIRRIFETSNVNSRLHHVGDAIEARAYLSRQDPYKSAPSPGLVLLDASISPICVRGLISALMTDRRFAEIPAAAVGDSVSAYRFFVNRRHAVDGSPHRPRSLGELALAIARVSSTLTRAQTRAMVSGN